MKKLSKLFFDKMPLTFSPLSLSHTERERERDRLERDKDTLSILTKADKYFVTEKFLQFIVTPKSSRRTFFIINPLILNLF